MTFGIIPRDYLGVIFARSTCGILPLARERSGKNSESEPGSHVDTHFAREQPLAVQELILQAQRLKEKGWLLLQRNDQELALSQLNITPEALEMAQNLED